jgi:hypothetical protein
VRTLIRGSAIREAGNIVLDLRVKALAELQYDVGAFEVVSPSDHLMEVVNILVNSFSALVIS